MSFLKGLFSFIVMLVLSIGLFMWVSFNVLSDTVLSSNTNKRLLEETSFSSELVDAVLDKYNTNLGQLSFEEDDLMKLVDDSGESIIDYVFADESEMPSVDVSFIKEHLEKLITEESKKALDGKLDPNEFIQFLRELPDGESISGYGKSYFLSIGIEVSNEKLDELLSIYKDNRDESNEVISEKIIKAIAYEVVDIQAMNTELSLQSFFDNLTEKNPFTIAKDIMDIYYKNINGYLVILIVLLVLILVLTEFRVGTSSMWIGLSMVIAILPLQAIRIGEYFVDKLLPSTTGNVLSYKEFMLSSIIDSLNKYSIIFAIVIVILFVLGRVFSKKIDGKLDNTENKIRKKFLVIRFIAFCVVCFGIYLCVNSSINMNLDMYSEIRELGPSDFTPRSIDLTLRELLNVNYDF